MLFDPPITTPCHAPRDRVFLAYSLRILAYSWRARISRIFVSQIGIPAYSDALNFAAVLHAKLVVVDSTCSNFHEMNEVGFNLCSNFNEMNEVAWHGMVGALNVPGEHLLDHSVANAVAVKCDAQMVWVATSRQQNVQLAVGNPGVSR